MEILVAEDEETTRFKLVKFLEDWGFDTDQSDNGMDALNKISRWEKPGIVILDWEMPKMEGIEVCRQVRKDPRMKNTYIIMLTSRDKHEDMMASFESGVDDYLSKPFSKDELRARINAGERIIRLEQELDRRAKDAERRYFELFRTHIGGIIEMEYSSGETTISEIMIKNANPTILSMIGNDSDNESPLNLQLIVHGGDHSKIESMVNSDTNDLSDDKIHEIRFVGKKGDITWTSCRLLPFSSEQEGSITAALQVKDITEEKLDHQERMKKILSFVMDEGNVYLVFESKMDDSIKAFRELDAIGYHGTALSRSMKKDLSSRTKCDLTHFWLSNTGESNSIKPDTEGVLETISNLPNKEIILMDRIDYLISRNSFHNVLHFVQSLKDQMVLNESIAILSIDPATISERERALLLKECSELKPVFKENISIDLFNILKTIQKNQIKHIEPSMKIIEDELGISRPTARKRINQLVDFGYIIEIGKGREKIFQLSDKGVSIISRD